MRIGILEDRHSSLGGRTRNGHILFTGGQMLSSHKPQKRLCFALHKRTVVDIRRQSTDDTSVSNSYFLIGMHVDTQTEHL